MIKNWLTVPEAAKYFDMKAKTLYSLIARGRLPEGSVLRLGRLIRIRPATIEAQAEEKK